MSPKFKKTPADPAAAAAPKQKSLLGIFAAVFLGVTGGSLPWFSTGNLWIYMALSYVRIPLLIFFFFLTITKFLVSKFLGGQLGAWGLSFLTSETTIQSAMHISQAPVLCFLQWNNARICGGLLFGLTAGAALGFLITVIVATARARTEKSHEI